ALPVPLAGRRPFVRPDRGRGDRAVLGSETDPSRRVVGSGLYPDPAVLARGVAEDQLDLVIRGVRQALSPGRVGVREVEQADGALPVGDGQPQTVLGLDEAGTLRVAEPVRVGAGREPGDAGAPSVARVRDRAPPRGPR